MKSKLAPPARPLLRLVDVAASDAERLPTGVPELDRVLGGGLVPASLVLVSGDPGIGKSTLLLMALRDMSERHEVVLVTGEESSAQVRLRADRLGGGAGVQILAETSLPEICATLERERPEVCVIDSVQTLYDPELGSAPGSVAQVREAAGRLLRLAKEHGIATFLVGHVTKEGAVAGPRVLEHLVDCVLQFEGDRYRSHRVLRAVKNRFGSTNELGVFEMTSDRPRRRRRSLRALRAVRGRGRLRRRVRPGRNASDPARDPGARLADRSRNAEEGGNRRRPEAPVHDRRRPGPPCGCLSRPGGRVRERRRRRSNRRAWCRPRGRSRDRLGCPWEACPAWSRMLCGGRPHRPAAPRLTGRAAPRRDRQARPFRGRRFGRDEAAWQNHPAGGGDDSAGDRGGAG